MRIGPLNRLITIEQKAQTRDALGGVAAGWSEFTKAWAAINPVSGSSRYVSAERHSEATHQITIRWVNGVTPKMRVVYGIRVFEIISALNIAERNKQMIIVAKEVLDG
ncbi:MAG: phage head closure protein [Sulfurovaceae bacterium]|nr:phage head closure protein [Sulfurovaceae bacterium]